MELNYQTAPDYHPVPKKNGTRTFMNSMGAVIFGGFLLQSLTVPFTISNSGEFSRIEEIKMGAGKFMELSLFTLVCAVLYYLLVNLYFTGEKGRRISLYIIALLGIFSIVAVVYLVQHPMSH
ncbi:hypothetical protein [Rossellomorea aquimaris]|uniref:Uncharacterized protein n=1 Tax=Rossellomorea aquimaris TaxID=189382 RepID=A0A1J6WJY1_9BACI|nr:hypothetical protein [Rossellomorea aquimaris]OIU68563.1 hypothetical protein BHE18_16680 [Rossellomorea aquimaris]